MPKESHKQWEEKINHAKKAKDEWWEQFKVDLALQYFEGNQNPGYNVDEWITVNKIYAHLMAQLPALYSIDPYFYIKLKKTYSPDPNAIIEFERRGKVRQAMVNYLKSELELKTKARLAIQDAHFAFGSIKVRFSADEMENPNAGKPIEDESGEPLKDEDTGEALVEPDTLPTNKQYIISRVHPDSLVWDVDASTLHDTWGFVAEQIKMTRDEALNDSRFKRATIQSMNGSRQSEPENKKRKLFSKNNAQTEKKDDDILVFWELYDLKKKQMLMIGEGADDFVIKPRGLPPGMENHPYSFLRFVLRHKSPYPIPPISQGMDQQREYNLNRSRIQTHRKRFNRKYTVIAQALTDDSDLSKLENGEDGTVIVVNSHGAIEPIKDAPLDQQNYQELALLNNDLVEVFGNPDTARGIASADSATEASILDSRLEVREGDRLSTVVDFILDVAKKLDQLVSANMDTESAIRITGPEGESWVRIKPDDFEKIQGEFEYSVNMGATQPRLPDIERAQMIAFMSQVVMPMPQILTAPNFMKRMAEMFHIEDEAILQELQQLGQQIMSGQAPPPGNQGTPANNPVSQVIGAATGQQGGNANGGGSQV